MKNIIKLIILVVILVINIQSQVMRIKKELTSQEKQEYINAISKEAKDNDGMFYDGIRFYKITEAIPKIESLIWEMNTSKLNTVLFTLHVLDSPNIINLVNAVFDSIQVAESQGRLFTDNTYLEPTLYQIMFARKDFSRAEEYFSKLESPNPKKYNLGDGILITVYYTDIDVMLALLLSDQYKHRIKKHIANYIKRGSGTIRDARLSLYYYAKEYKEEAYELIKESFSKYGNHEIRWWILEEIFQPLNRIEWLDYYKQLFDNDPAYSVREQIASILIYDFKSIDNVDFINQRWNNLPLELRKRINYINNLDYFYSKPKYPNLIQEDPQITEVIDTLLVYNNETRRVGWIKADSTRDKYAVYINNAKNYLNQNKQYDLKQEMIKLQAEVKKDTLTAINMLAHNWLNESIRYVIEKLKDVEEPIIIEKTAKQLLEELAAINQTNRTTGKYSADWVYTVLKSSIDNGLLMLSLNVPASSLVIMEQFNITATGYKNSSFINPEGYNLLKTKNDEVIVALKKLTN